MTLPAPLLPRRCVLAGLPAWMVLIETARADDEPPMRVTTDSREYCTWLVGQVRQERRARRPEPLPEEVRLLSVEGRKMCDEGHLRPGILRLRRALQILRGE